MRKLEFELIKKEHYDFDKQIVKYEADIYTIYLDTNSIELWKDITNFRERPEGDTDINYCDDVVCRYKAKQKLEFEILKKLGLSVESILLDKDYEYTMIQNYRNIFTVTVARKYYR